MSVATGIGSWPGDDIVEAIRVVWGELPLLPHLPELPARGAIASITGRGAAITSELGFDLQPAGWRLTDAPGVDHRRARSLLARDLDALEEHATGYAGELKVQVAGPWTMAATVEKPRGDKVLSDVGARRDLAQALAEGITAHVTEVRRRIPGAEVIVQVDEPALPAVLAGRVPTASGFHRHRSVHLPDAAAPLEWVFRAIEHAGGAPAVHCCAAEVPVALLRESGARMVSVDLHVLAAHGYDAIGTALEAGERVLLGVFAHDDRPDARAGADRARRLLDMLGHDPGAVRDQVVLTPACGLAGASPDSARRVLVALSEAARMLSD